MENQLQRISGTGLMQQQQASSTSKVAKLSPKEKKLGKALLEVNKIIMQPKGENEIADWAMDIERLRPETEPEHVQLVFDLVKLGLLEWDNFKGMQNIYQMLEQTERFYNRYMGEIRFKESRAEWIKKNGKKAFLKFIVKRYQTLLTECQRRLEITDPKCEEAKYLRSELKKATLLAYRHPAFHGKETLLIASNTGYADVIRSWDIHDIDFENPKTASIIAKYRQSLTVSGYLSSGKYWMNLGYVYDLFDKPIKAGYPNIYHTRDYRSRICLMLNRLGEH